MSLLKRILFLGELPPNTIHGISLANKINIDILKEKFEFDIIEERNTLANFNKISVLKFLKSAKLIYHVIKKSLTHKYKYFYLIFKLSTFGSCKTLIAILIFRLFNNGKVVLHIHRGDFFSKYYLSKINQLISKLIFLQIDKLIVLSQNQKIEFETIFNIKCEVLYNTVEIELNTNNVNRNNFKFIFISNYILEKGILDLLKVFKHLSDSFPDIKLHTYGAFTDQRTKEQILKYNSNSIIIHGTLFGIEKYNKIREADCLILPSWSEGQPTVILEAMSVGTPVISTNVGLIPELLGENYPFLAISKDLNSLEKTIIDFIKSKRNSQLSYNLYNNYFNSYSQKNHSVKLNQIFL